MTRRPWTVSHAMLLGSLLGAALWIGIFAVIRAVLR
jgi:hypothetical protein